MVLMEGGIAQGASHQEAKQQAWRRGQRSLRTQAGALMAYLQLRAAPQQRPSAPEWRWHRAGGAPPRSAAGGTRRLSGCGPAATAASRAQPPCRCCAGSLAACRLHVNRVLPHGWRCHPLYSGKASLRATGHRYAQMAPVLQDLDCLWLN